MGNITFWSGAVGDYAVLGAKPSARSSGCIISNVKAIDIRKKQQQRLGDELFLSRVSNGWPIRKYTHGIWSFKIYLYDCSLSVASVWETNISIPEFYIKPASQPSMWLKHMLQKMKWKFTYDILYGGKKHIFFLKKSSLIYKKRKHKCTDSSGTAACKGHLQSYLFDLILKMEKSRLSHWGFRNKILWAIRLRWEVRSQ